MKILKTGKTLSEEEVKELKKSAQIGKYDTRNIFLLTHLYSGKVGYQLDNSGLAGSLNGTYRRIIDVTRKLVDYDGVPVEFQPSVDPCKDLQYYYIGFFNTYADRAAKNFFQDGVCTWVAGERKFLTDQELFEIQKTSILKLLKVSHVPANKLVLARKLALKYKLITEENV